MSTCRGHAAYAHVEAIRTSRHMPVGWSSTYADAYAVSAMGAGLVGCNAGGRWMEDASEDLWNIKKRACGLMWSPLLYLILETCLWIDVVSISHS